MNIKQTIIDQTEKALLANGSAWLLVAGQLLEEIEKLSARVQELDLRMAMYDTPSTESVREPVVEADPFTKESWAEEGASAEEVVAGQLRELISSGDAERERRDAGLSAAAVGIEVGVTGGAVRGWETGQWFPTAAAAERYLSFLMGLRHGTRVEESKPVDKAVEPNGKKCAFCKKDLVGLQRRFCSNECSGRYSYVKSQNPEATNSDVETIIAGAGVLPRRGRKYRRYKKLDEVRAAKALQRARESEVPALT